MPSVVGEYHGLILILISVQSKYFKTKLTDDTQTAQNEFMLYPNYFKNHLVRFDSIKWQGKLSELKNNSIYRGIVTDQKVSTEFLPALNCLSVCIRNMYAEKNNFEIPDHIYKQLKKEEIDFSLLCMSLEYAGGFSKELVGAFERYKLQFGYYGLPGTIFFNEHGEKIGVVNGSYNLTPLFALLDSTNKKLANSIYEANTKGIDNWEENKTPLLYSYLSNKDEYYKYIMTVDPESPYAGHYDYKMTSKELSEAYNENEVAADQKYKGKKILLTGKVESINKDVLEESYITLEGDTYFGTINCSVNNENIAASIKKNNQYSLIGVCTGMILGNVMLSNCQLQ